MNFKKSMLSAAVVTAIGAGATLVPTVASSAPLFSGDWALTIAPTATKTTSYGGTDYKIGKDGNWQSSFTFGTLPGSMSNVMTDNGTLVSGLGTSIAGDGFAGVIALTVDATTGDISVAGESMTGNLSGGGDMSFTPTGRRGSINAPVLNADWNIDDANCDTTGCTSNGNTAWSSFTTGTATAAKGSINGSALVDAGDLDGDAINDYSGILVQGAQVGSQWGSFFGATYYEAWRVNILSDTAKAGATGFNVDTIFATAGGDFAQYTTSAVPVPAAVWLFGSGLMGLVGVARRKKA